jgi:cation transport ATPase
MVKSYKLEELDCANCAAKMESDINKLEGVKNARVNFMQQKLKLEVTDGMLEDVLAKAQTICKKYEPDCRIVY